MTWYFKGDEEGFMKMRKISIMLVATTLLTLCAFTASATVITDGQGDVWHWVPPNYVSNTVSQPNVDIKEISATTSNHQVTLTFTLWPGGQFNRSGKEAAVYWLVYTSSDANYSMMYINTINQSLAIASGVNTAGNMTIIPSFGTPIINGNTMTCTLNLTGESTTETHLYAYCWLYDNYQTGNYLSGEAWLDWAGDYTFNGHLYTGNNTGGNNTGGNTGGNNTGGNTTGKKTPGFEVAPVIAAVAVAAILLRRRR